MSKTDKTLPLHVKLKNGDLDWEEVHNHDTGPCDLGPASDLSTYGWVSGEGKRCYRSFVYTGTHICCCTHCHGDWFWDYPPGKRQRINGKRECQKWLREYRTGEAGESW